MRRILAILLMLGFVQVSFGQLSGPLSGIYGPGTYHVVGDILVLSGDVAQLQPGTTFLFDGPFRFHIEGTLDAVGNDAEHIIFTATEPQSPWRGLRFINSASSGSQLKWCEIEYGHAQGTSPHNNGGGIYCEWSSPSFDRCIIRNNTADNYGGGVYVFGSTVSPTFESCHIYSNSATGGGGVACDSCGGTFTNCFIYDNSSNDGGGVLSLLSLAPANPGVPVFEFCTISSNSATNHGAGVSCWGASPKFSSTIISFSNGEGIYFLASDESVVHHCDIYGNSGGDIVFYDNDPTHGPPNLGTISTTNSNGDPCDTYYNISFDPEFVNPPLTDMHLTDVSRCIGAGHCTIYPPYDFEGDSRPDPAGTCSDIGADESPQAFPPIIGLVISISGGDAVLNWPAHPIASAYDIYGSTEPFVAGTWLARVWTPTSTWTDVNAAITRPSPYFYYITVSN